jgi:hypothetical protein
MCEDKELGTLSYIEVKIIKEYREQYIKKGDFWLARSHPSLCTVLGIL